MEYTRNMKYAILVVISLATFQTPFMGSALNLASPALAKYFSMNAVVQGWAVTIFLLSSAIFAVPFAKLGDIWGRKKVFLIGTIILTIASVLCSLASTTTYFMIFRFMQGVGSAMVFGTNMAILISVFSPKERGKVLGINASVVYFSIAVGPLLGGWLTDQFGWQSIFYVNTIAGLLVIAGIIGTMPTEWTESKDDKFDWVGVFIYGIGLSGIIYGFAELPNPWGFLIVGVGLILLCLFAFYENKFPFPIFNVKMFVQNRVFRLSSFAALINYAATFGIGFMLSLYLQYIKGYSAQEAGLILIIQPVVQGFFSILSGRLSDKINASKLATSGMALIVVALLLMLLLHENTPIIFLSVALVILGIGFALFSSPNMNVIMSSVEKQYLGMASATTSTMRLTGQSFSMGVVLMVMSIFIGRVKISSAVHAELMQSMHVIFIVFAVFCAVGVYFSMARNNGKTNTNEIIC